MGTIPNSEEILKEFSELFSNEAITAVSIWHETNTDTPTNEEDFLQRAQENIAKLSGKLTSALQKI